MKRLIRKIRSAYFGIINFNKSRYNSTQLDNNLSDSEKSGLYLSEIRSILKSQKLFNNFKRNVNYMIVLEHVSEIQGEQYLEVLRRRNDEVLEKALNSVFVTDQIGNPKKILL